MFNRITGAELILLRVNDAGKGDYEFQATLATETARNGQVPVAHGFNQMDAFEPEGEDANFFTFQAGQSTYSTVLLYSAETWM